MTKTSAHLVTRNSREESSWPCVSQVITIYIPHYFIFEPVCCGVLCSEHVNYLNMKFLILSVCVAMAAADVSHILPKAANDESKATIEKQGLDVGQDGQYAWNVQTSNGIVASASGSLKNAGSEEPAQVVQGAASWTSPEGELVQFQYVADENGYQPQGSHIPTSPPIPEAIQRSLRYIQEHPQKDQN